MDYEKKYKQLYTLINDLYPHMSEHCKEKVEGFFPELTESEDEKIRKELLEHCKKLAEMYNTLLTAEEYNKKQSWIAWLEKQKEFTSDEEKQGKEDVLWCINQAKKHAKDENEMGTCWLAEKWLEKQGDAKQELEKQDKYTEINRGKNYLCTKTHKYAGEEWREGIKYFAPEDYTLINQGCAYYCPAWSKEEHNNFFKEVKYAEVTPKFKVDDWITDGEYTWKIIDIRQLDYILQSQDGKVVDDTISYVDEHFHLWTIKDAKDGEVLVDDIDGRPFIFEGFSDSNHPNSPVAYCGINSECDFRVSYGSYRWTDKDVKPSTKEQSDRLFQKMEKAGYKWDSQNKQILSRIN